MVYNFVESWLPSAAMIILLIFVLYNLAIEVLWANLILLYYVMFTSFAVNFFSPKCDKNVSPELVIIVLFLWFCYFYRRFYGKTHTDATNVQSPINKGNTIDN